MDRNNEIFHTPKEYPPFDGFPAGLPDFLWGLALNNERPWFADHKQEYETCLHAPFESLAHQVCDAFGQAHPGIAPQLHISRIYRDARRLYGRGPYNNHLWFSFGQSGGIYDMRPKFWFGIEARCAIWGVGSWTASGAFLQRWREKIDADPKEISKIVRALNRDGRFQPVGEKYKRPKGDPGPLLYDWYNTREVGVSCTEWFDPAPPGADLAGRLAADFELLLPLYRYLLSIADELEEAAAEEN